MAQTREQQILGALLVTPALQNRVDLNKSFFKTDKQRLIFDELKKGAVDAAVVAQRIRQRTPSFDDVDTYISACMEGVHHMTPNGLQQMIADEKKRRLQLEIGKELQERIINHDKLKRIYGEIKALESICKRQ